MSAGAPTGPFDLRFTSARCRRHPDLEQPAGHDGWRLGGSPPAGQHKSGGVASALTERSDPAAFLAASRLESRLAPRLPPVRPHSERRARRLAGVMEARATPDDRPPPRLCTSLPRSTLPSTERSPGHRRPRSIGPYVASPGWRTTHSTTSPTGRHGPSVTARPNSGRSPTATPNGWRSLRSEPHRPPIGSVDQGGCGSSRPR
jgi:hypothetical protein